MSYARWSESMWYVYRERGPEEWHDVKNFQTLEIMWSLEAEGSARYTYAQLSTSRITIMDTIKARSKCSEYQIRELCGYVDQFMLAIDKEYREER